MQVAGSAVISGTLAIDVLFGATLQSGTEASFLGASGFLLGGFNTIPVGWFITDDGHDLSLVNI